METPEKKAEHSVTADRIGWHPAFFEAIQMELDEYSHVLQFIYQQQLTTEPLRIDVVIIKKTADIPIKKNIAAIFRKVNILEYKSPDISVSVRDFYHVYAYACLYLSLNDDIDINDITLTFVESHYPRELVRHFTEKRNYTVEESTPGIYSVIGDILPIQIIDSRRLSADENIWLKELDNMLDASRIQRLTEEIKRLGKAARINAYIDVITRANWESLQEAFKMSDTLLTMDEVLEKVGLVARWEARGKAEIVRNMLKKGFSPEQISELSGLDMEQITALAAQE